jgi:hypothetical protein
VSFHRASGSPSISSPAAAIGYIEIADGVYVGLGGASAAQLDLGIGYAKNRSAGGPVPETDDPPAGGVVVGVPTMLKALRALGTTGWAGPSLVSPAV